MSISNQDGEFVGAFEENEMMQVNANALLRLINSFKSGQTHRVMEHWALRNHEGSEIAILTDNIRTHAGIVSEDETKSIRETIPELDIAATYPKSFASGFVVGEIVRRESGGPFIDVKAGVSTLEAVLAGVSKDGKEVIYALPEGNVVIWRDNIRFLDHVESTGRHISKEARNHLMNYVAHHQQNYE